MREGLGASGHAAAGERRRVSKLCQGQCQMPSRHLPPSFISWVGTEVTGKAAVSWLATASYLPPAFALRAQSRFSAMLCKNTTMLCKNSLYYECSVKQTQLCQTEPTQEQQQ